MSETMYGVAMTNKEWEEIRELFKELEKTDTTMKFLSRVNSSLEQ